MAIYFLHVQNATEKIEDLEGEECDTLDLAIDAAVDSARELLIDRLRSKKPADGEGSRIEVADSAGHVLAVIEMKDVLKGKF